MCCWFDLRCKIIPISVVCNPKIALFHNTDLIFMVIIPCMGSLIGSLMHGITLL